MSRLTTWFQSLGPGFITGASDDDPAGIATYVQSSAQFGYQPLWLAFFTTPFMYVIQEMCGRLGLAKRKGIAAVIRERYGRTILYPTLVLLLTANIVNIGADLGAMAASLHLLVPAPFVILLCAIAITTVCLEVFISYKTYAKYLRFLTLSLFAYIIVALIVDQDWLAVIRATLLPHIALTKEYLLMVVAVLGTTISPYLFFWQANEEVEEYAGTIFRKPDIARLDRDTWTGMIFSNAVMFFVMLTAAATLFPAGIVTIETASQAAEALRPFAGDAAYLLFTIAIIGTGLLAVPVLAGSAGYAVAEAFGWEASLSKRVGEAKGFYAVIALATIAGLLMNLSGIAPFRMLFYSAVLNGILAPILMTVIVILTSDKSVMGSLVNTKRTQVFAWIITGFMTLAALALFAFSFL